MFKDKSSEKIEHIILGLVIADVNTRLMRS